MKSVLTTVSVLNENANVYSLMSPVVCNLRFETPTRGYKTNLRGLEMIIGIRGVIVSLLNKKKKKNSFQFL